MYYHAIHTLTIDRICHYYLEQGHTQNEGDSMHSTIDRICHYYLEHVFRPSYNFLRATAAWITVCGS